MTSLYTNPNETNSQIPLQVGAVSQGTILRDEIDQRAANVNEIHSFKNDPTKSHIGIYPHGSDPIAARTGMGQIIMIFNNVPPTSFGNGVAGFSNLNGLFYNYDLPNGGLNIRILGVAGLPHDAKNIGDRSGFKLITHGTVAIPWDPISKFETTDLDGKKYTTPAPSRWEPGQMACMALPTPEETEHRKERGNRIIIPNIVPYSWGAKHDKLRYFADLNNGFLTSFNTVRRNAPIEKQIKTLDPKNNSESESRQMMVAGGMENISAEALKLCSLTSAIHLIGILMRRGILTLGKNTSNAFLTNSILSESEIPIDEESLLEYEKFLKIINFFDSSSQPLINKNNGGNNQNNNNGGGGGKNIVENAKILQKDIYTALSWPHVPSSDKLMYEPKLFKTTDKTPQPQREKERKFKNILQQSSNYFFKWHGETLKKESETLLGPVLEPVDPNDASQKRIPILLTKNNACGWC